VTRGEAKTLLMLGDLATIYANMPMGTTLRLVFLDLISGATGSDLDTMVEKCLGLKRHIGIYVMGCNSPAETDVKFRERAEQCSYILDSYTPPVSVPDAPVQTQCFHYWKSYQGILEKYDYCDFCDLKRNQ